MNFIAGTLLGFIIGCAATFYYFRSRWLKIKGLINNGVDVEQALFEQVMPSEKGDFIVQNHAQQVMRNATGDIRLGDIINDDE